MLTTEQEVNIRKLATMIRGIKVAMLTTMGSDRSLCAADPWPSQEADFDGTLWFFTQASSEKTTEIRLNPQVNASYVSTDGSSLRLAHGTCQRGPGSGEDARAVEPRLQSLVSPGSRRSGTRALES